MNKVHGLIARLVNGEVIFDQIVEHVDSVTGSHLCFVRQDEVKFETVAGVIG